MVNIGYLRSRAKIKDIIGGRVNRQYFDSLIYFGMRCGVQWVFFTQRDIDFRAGMVRGAVYCDGKFERRVVGLPKIIDNRDYLLPFSKFAAMGVLLLCIPGEPGKDVAYDMLRQGGRFSEILIPTKKATSFEDIEDALDAYGTIIVKPISSLWGRGVRQLSRTGGGYAEVHKQKRRHYSHNQLRGRWHRKAICPAGLFSGIRNKVLQSVFRLDESQFVVQPYIPSVTKNGEPFDIRIFCSRGDGGKFGHRAYVRVGSPKGVISNLAAGGFAVPLDPFLRINFDSEETRKEISDRVAEIGNEFPDHYCSFFEKDLHSIGIDIGVAHEGERVRLCLFEVNTVQVGIAGAGPEEALRHCRYVRWLHLNSESGIRNE